MVICDITKRRECHEIINAIIKKRHQDIKVGTKTSPYSLPASSKVEKAFAWLAASQKGERYQTISTVKVAGTTIDLLLASSHHAREPQAMVR